MRIDNDFKVFKENDEYKIVQTITKTLGFKECLAQLDMMESETAQIINKKNQLKKDIGEKKLETELEECDKIIVNLQKLSSEWNKTINKDRNKLFEDIKKRGVKLKKELSVGMSEDQKKFILRDEVFKRICSEQGLAPNNSLISKARLEFDTW